MFKANKTTDLFFYVLLLLGAISTIYVGISSSNSIIVPLFLLPLSFTICCAFFRNILPYHRGGFGLKVLYSVILVRYVVIPVVTCVTGSYSSLGIYSDSAYSYGIFMQVLELFVTCIVIKSYFLRVYTKCNKRYKSSNKKHYYDTLSLGGIIVILFSLYVINSRGWDTLLTSMRFLILSERLEEDELYGYDIWMAHTLMAFLVIVITAIFQKREDQKKSIFNIIIPLVVTFFSCALSFGNNRMTTVYYAISALAILLMTFPHRKAIVTGTIIPTFLVVIVSFTMIKQYNYDVTSGTDSGLDDDDLVVTLSAYVSTTQNTAKAYDMYTLNGSEMTAGSVVADFVNGIMILKLPMFISITKPILKIPTSIKLASTSTEVVPMSGQALFYGGHIFGWLLDVLFFIILIYLLLLTDCYSKLEKRLGNKYLLTWISVTFGMVMTYNLSIIWASLNETPFFTLCALFLNRVVYIKRQPIKEVVGR